MYCFVIEKGMKRGGNTVNFTLNFRVLYLELPFRGWQAFGNGVRGLRGHPGEGKISNSHSVHLPQITLQLRPTVLLGLTGGSTDKNTVVGRHKVI